MLIGARPYLISLAFTVGIISCSDAPVGYDTWTEGTYFEVKGFGEGPTVLKEGYVATIALKTGFYGRMRDVESIMEMDPSNLNWGQSPFIAKVGAEMKSGDSIDFIVPYAEIKGSFLDEFSGIDNLSDTTRIDFEIVVRKLYNEQEYFVSPEYFLLQQAIKERERIVHEMEKQGLDELVKPFAGSWCRVLKEGEGKTPSPGEALTVKLTGMFLNGDVFDQAKDSTEYLYFDYGKPDQVVKGIQQNIGYMKQGEVREVWLPSDLAFGMRGSKGIVPPNEPVRFEIEMIQIGVDSSFVTK